MMKIILPLILALLGLGAGVGAGLAFRPPVPEKEAAAEACAALPAPEAETAAPTDAEHASEEEHGEPATADPCATAAADPFAEPAEAEAHDPDLHLVSVPIEKSFVVPVFKDEKIAAMIVLSLSVETDEKQADLVTAMEPRLRDQFLQVMFLHANSGGFDGSFTQGQKMADLRAGLLASAKEVMGEVLVNGVLITEIARQDL